MAYAVRHNKKPAATEEIVCKQCGETVTRLKRDRRQYCSIACQTERLKKPPVVFDQP